MKPKEKSEHAKDDRWKVPVDLPHVKPEDYPVDIDSANGSAAENAGKKKPDAGPPDYTFPGYPSSKKD